MTQAAAAKRYYEKNKIAINLKCKLYYQSHSEKWIDYNKKISSYYNKCVFNPACKKVGGRGAKFYNYFCLICGKEKRVLLSHVEYTYKTEGRLPKYCSRKCYGVSLSKKWRERSPYAQKIKKLLKTV